MRQTAGASRSENFLENQDVENPGGDADLYPRLAEIQHTSRRAA